MSYEMDTAKMLEVLRIGQEKVSDKAIQSVEKRVGPLRHQTQLPREEIIQRMISTFAERNTESGLTEDRLSPEELAEAEELATPSTAPGSGSTLYPDPAGSSSPASPATAREGGTDRSRGDSHRRYGRGLHRERVGYGRR